MLAAEKLRQLTALFRSADIPDPQIEAEFLLLESLGMDKTELYACDRSLNAELSEVIDSLAKRRAGGEPLQYVLGNVEFSGLLIRVGSGVLIPRPETELLVEEAIKLLKPWSAERLDILDLCTGSGCIALGLAKHLPAATVTGVDISQKALEYARLNMEANGISGCKFLEGDLYAPVGEATFDCIVSNPPYIKTSCLTELQREIKEHEPVLALDGGIDGMDYYRRILSAAPTHLKGGGVLILEAGFDQAGDIRRLCSEAGLCELSFVRDYAGIERVFMAHKDIPSSTA